MSILTRSVTAAICAMAVAVAVVGVAVSDPGRSAHDKRAELASRSAPEGSAALARARSWPRWGNTGVADCPRLRKRAPSSGVVVLSRDGAVLKNVEYTRNVVILIAADNVTVRCVKLNGGGYYGIDNTDDRSVRGARVDRVEIDCEDSGDTIALLLHHAVVNRANVHHCNDMVMVGGDHLTIKNSYCHDLTSYSPEFHGDCIQNLGGNTGLRILHNSLWGWDTSDILLGQEYGEARNVVIRGNRLMSDPDITPPPAYLLYLSGTNTVVRDNFFTKRHSFGFCTDNRVDGNPVVWRNNRTWESPRRVINSC